LIEPVDSQELNRLLAEGDVRLRRSIEALKNSPRRPKDWEEITPAQLKSAIQHLRDEFKSQEWQITMRTECGCYLALHPELATQPTFKGGFTNLIPVERRAAWQQFYRRTFEPAIFKFWCDQLSENLVDSIIKTFDRILKIALTQQATLPLAPVEWTTMLAHGLLYSLERTLPSKIKAMCDEQKNRSDFAKDYFFAYCAWVYWRAPRFVHMKPSGNTSYDPNTAWEREDEDKTERLLHGLTERILDPARFKLKDLAGEAYVALASTAPERAPTENPPSHAQPTAHGTGETGFPNIDLRRSRSCLGKKGTCPIFLIRHSSQIAKENALRYALNMN